MRAPASPRDIPARPRPLGYASGRNEMPRHAHGLAIRARRPRPSEKIRLRVMPGFSPCGHLCWARPPWRGGLRTPAMKARASSRHVPHWATGPSGSPKRDREIPWVHMRPSDPPTQRTSLREDRLHCLAPAILEGGHPLFFRPLGTIVSQDPW
jgi:hypothetical protein